MQSVDLSNITGWNLETLKSMAEKLPTVAKANLGTLNYYIRQHMVPHHGKAILSAMDYLATLPDLTELDVTHAIFTQEEAEEFMNGLAKLTNLSSINMSGMSLFDTGLIQFGKAARQLPFLTKLDLSSPKTNDYNGNMQHMTWLGELNRLVDLKMASCGILKSDYEHMHWLASLQLTRLDLSNNYVDCLGEYMANNTSLESLSLFDGMVNTAALMQSLSSNLAIRRLSLVSVDINDERLVPICRWLKEHPNQLELLCLAHHAVRNLSPLAKVLKDNTSLTFLSISTVSLWTSVELNSTVWKDFLETNTTLNTLLYNQVVFPEVVRNAIRNKTLQEYT